MESASIFILIERVGAESAKSAKIALLSEHAGDEGLKRVLEATYSPLKTYGIAQRPVGAEPERVGAGFDEGTWSLLG